MTFLVPTKSIIGLATAADKTPEPKPMEVVKPLKITINFMFKYQLLTSACLGSLTFLRVVYEKLSNLVLRNFEKV